MECNLTISSNPPVSSCEAGFDVNNLTNKFSLALEKNDLAAIKECVQQIKESVKQFSDKELTKLLLARKVETGETGIGLALQNGHTQAIEIFNQLITDIHQDLSITVRHTLAGAVTEKNKDDVFPIDFILRKWGFGVMQEAFAKLISLLIGEVFTLSALLAKEQVPNLAEQINAFRLLMRATIAEGFTHQQNGMLDILMPEIDGVSAPRVLFNRADADAIYAYAQLLIEILPKLFPLSTDSQQRLLNAIAIYVVDIEKAHTPELGRAYKELETVVKNVVERSKRM
jgi:hypothetical protein